MHPARHSRSPQHTRFQWKRSRQRPLSHAVDPQGLTHTYPGPRAHPLPRGAGHTRREGLAGATVHRVGRRSDARASVWAWASFGGGATPSAPNTRGGPGCPTAARRDTRARERPRLPPRPRAAPLRRAAAAAREAQLRPRGAPCGPHYAGSGLAPGGAGVGGGASSPGLHCGRRHPPGAAAWKGPELPPRGGPKARPEPPAAACPARPARTPTRPRAGAASCFDRAGDRGGTHSRDAGKPGWDLDSGACEWGSPNPAGHLLGRIGLLPAPPASARPSSPLSPSVQELPAPT